MAFGTAEVDKLDDADLVIGGGQGGRLAADPRVVHDRLVKEHGDAHDEGCSLPSVSEDAPWFDLQSHSLHSDGALAPTEVIEHAARAGASLVALTDHDTVEGVDEALAAGARHGIEVVPATEVTVVDPVREDLHVLGYRVDHHEAGLLNLLEASRADRDARAGRMVDALRASGWEVDEGALRERSQTGHPVGRPHLAQAVLAEAANASRLADEGIADVTGLIVAYLIPGAPAFVARIMPEVPDAIAAIHAAGGVAVWAHPFWDVDDPELVATTVRRLAAAGLDGVEAFYVTHTREQTDQLAALCGELGLLATGSADFHGPEHRLFSRFRAFALHGHEPRLGPIAVEAKHGPRSAR
ncbi:MAG: PHP domain-containing protein [Solirubrobacteraceae bacterium MAG38_C4-C5]|nr:PHP domain-containing protein [Candidatus Siliceabacter maunaloa]